MMFTGKKGQFGASVLMAVILLNIIMYVFIFYANQSAYISIDSSGTIDDDTLSESDTFGWIDGFKISIFGLPAWFNYFYVTFMAALVIVAGWYAFKGN